MPNAVITGGGTGGHVYPALAVAQALKAKGWQLSYIGNLGKLESTLIPAEGIAFEGLTFSGMPRRLGSGFFYWLFQLIQAVLKARKILLTLKPNLVFATGGYVTAPVLMAAKSLGIPYVIHEPDAHPGMVNRLMARWAKHVTCAFEAAIPQLNNPTVTVTGNPLRGTIGVLSKAEALRGFPRPFVETKQTLLVTGGSQGAKQINQAVLKALPVLLGTMNLQVIHQTGESQYHDSKSACPAGYWDHPDYLPLPFIENMAQVLALADIALCRAGSMSLSEMAQAGLPTILIPYPYAAANHQYKNAMAVQLAGAALVILDKDLNSNSLTHALEDCLLEPTRFQAMQQAARQLAKPHATTEIVSVLHQCLAQEH